MTLPSYIALRWEAITTMIFFFCFPSFFFAFHSALFSFLKILSKHLKNSDNRDLQEVLVSYFFFMVAHLLTTNLNSKPFSFFQSLLLSRLPSVIANWSAVCDYVLDAGLGAARLARDPRLVRCVLLLGLTLPSSVRVCLSGLSLALPLDLILPLSKLWMVHERRLRADSGELYRCSIRVQSVVYPSQGTSLPCRHVNEFAHICQRIPLEYLC